MRAPVLAVLLVNVGCHAVWEAEIPERHDARESYVACPPSTSWNGEICVWRYVISDVRCPQSTVWDGRQCVATQVACPDGAAWDGDRCVPIGQHPSEGALVSAELPTESVEAVATPDAEPQEEARSPLPQAPLDVFNYR